MTSVNNIDTLYAGGFPKDAIQTIMIPVCNSAKE